MSLPAILITSVFRVLLLVLIGNLASPTIFEGAFHRHAGWVFFSLVFISFLYFAYGWMLPESAGRSVQVAHPKAV